MVISIALNIVRAAYDGSLAPGALSQARHWCLMILYTLVRPIIKFTPCLPKKEFLWINFSAGYLAIKKHRPLHRMSPTLLRYPSSRYRRLLIVRTHASIFSNSFLVVDSLWANSAN